MNKVVLLHVPVSQLGKRVCAYAALYDIPVSLVRIAVQGTFIARDTKTLVFCNNVYKDVYHYTKKYLRLMVDGESTEVLMLSEDTHA